MEQESDSSSDEAEDAAIGYDDVEAENHSETLPQQLRSISDHQVRMWIPLFCQSDVHSTDCNE